MVRKMANKKWLDDDKPIKRKPLNEKDYRMILLFAKNNMKIQATADEMGRHYNAVAWRIEKTKEVTGLDPRNFYDLIKLVDMANSRLGGNEDG